MIDTQVKHIVRRATRPEKLNVLVIGATHERYEQALCKTGHNFYSMIMGKEWSREYGLPPDNYNIVKWIPAHLDVDLVLVHTSDQRLEFAIEIAREFGVRVIRHTHTVPNNQEEIIQHNGMKPDFNTFISEYSMLQWGCESSRSSYINHGLDTEFWKDLGHERKGQCLSVVNLWAQRDWACGWSLWNQAKKDLPVMVLGSNPGLSNPSPTIESLRGSYNDSLVFLNTSLHSPVPMSLLEAMACGCAVVTTGTCMIPEIVKHKHNGLIANTPQEINECCKYLLSHPEVAKQYGKAAADTIKNNYNISQFVDGWNQTFKKALMK